MSDEHEEWLDPDLNYLVMSAADPLKLCEAVSKLRRQGWQLHGEMKMQASADVSSLTFARLFYVQALYKEVG